MEKTWYWMVFLGAVRALLAAAGGWLQSHGLIDPDTHQRLMSEGVTQVAGWLMIALAIGWSALQKTQMVSWIKTALHLSPGAPVAEVKSRADDRVTL